MAMTEAATLMTTWREEKEDKKCKVKKVSFLRTSAGLFYKEKINSFWEGNKEILSCLEDKSNDYSLE